MKQYVLLALALFALSIGAVSVRLLGLAWRTRKAPELLLGLSTAFPLVGYSLAVFGTALGQGVTAKWITEVTGAFCDIGFIATIGFVWLVFRREERWAKALSFAIVLSFAAMPFINHFVAWQDRVPSALVPRGALRSICYAWAAFESLQYAQIMRRRVRYGLAEPLVADRFTLWGLAHLCLVFMLLLLMAGVKLHLSGADFARACTVSGFVFGVLGAVPLMLSFFPPNAYARYVEKRFRAEQSA